MNAVSCMIFFCTQRAPVFGNLPSLKPEHVPDPFPCGVSAGPVVPTAVLAPPESWSVWFWGDVRLPRCFLPVGGWSVRSPDTPTPRGRDRRSSGARSWSGPSFPGPCLRRCRGEVAAKPRATAAVSWGAFWASQVRVSRSGPRSPGVRSCGRQVAPEPLVGKTTAAAAPSCGLCSRVRDPSPSPSGRVSGLVRGPSRGSLCLLSTSLWGAHAGGGVVLGCSPPVFVGTRFHVFRPSQCAFLSLSCLAALARPCGPVLGRGGERGPLRPAGGPRRPRGSCSAA